MGKIIALVLFCLFFCASSRWTQEEAKQWYEQFRWSAGFNYAPSYAANQLQMWLSMNQTVIDRQLAWASDIGFSKLRVFLHVGLYIVSPTILFDKMNRFLTISSKHNHGVIFVLFDDCWKGNWQIGTQPDPIPGVHNSQWVQSPGQQKIQDITLQQYVKDVINHFRNDKRIVMWDLYNQVGNSGKKKSSLPLVKNAFSWARSAKPIQPLTSGTWNTGIQFQQINNFILSESDIITFHAYCDVLCTKQTINRLQKHRRPIICTEYMARPLQSKFITHLPIFKEKNIWAINWGFVFGRTQTYYPWWSKQGDPVPKVWFHDVIHQNGTSFDEQQTTFIKQITSQ